MSVPLQLQDKQLLATLLVAAELCQSRQEEEGGIILLKDDQYVFEKIKNKNSGRNEASVLYEVTSEGMQEQIFPRLKDGWKMHASFHTHPSFSTTPSSIDLGKLFLGFRYNFIYSPSGESFSLSEWIDENSCVYYVPKKTIKFLLK